jgi:2-octaprenylphenol hydroxylase
MKRPFDIAIVGAGISGLMLAAKLAGSAAATELRITVIDATPRPTPSPDDDVALRVSAIATGSVDMLESVGAWEHVDASRRCAYEKMRVWDENGSPDSNSALQFDAAGFAVPQLGFIVENVLLRAALLRRLDDADVALRFETPIRALRQLGQRYCIDLEDDELHADLVVGADGSRSFVRTEVGIESRLWPYGQTAFVTHLQPEEPHCATAWQRFLKDGPLGILPLADGRVSIVWSTRPENAGRAGDADDVQLGRILSSASDHVLGSLEVAGPRGSFPLAAQHAERYVLPGIALIGDAAHAIHPLAGQGANLGLRDADELAEVVISALQQGQHPADLPVLRRYERARRGSNATMLHLMTALNRLFTTDSTMVAELRMAGMRLFNRSGPIRERAVRVALGVG